MKKSGLLLILGGLLGIAFFLATDARLVPKWATYIGWSANQVDAVQDSLVGTIIGLLTSLAVIAVGVWLLFRRAI